MIEILGEVVMEMTCDRCGAREITKLFIEEHDNQAISVPLPDRWRRVRCRERLELRCKECYECDRHTMTVC